MDPAKKPKAFTNLRVILAFDGTIHIAHYIWGCTLCTVGKLALLLDGKRIPKEAFLSPNESTSKDINPTDKDIDGIPGITLAIVTELEEYKCNYLMLHRLYHEVKNCNHDDMPLIFDDRSAAYHEADGRTAVLRMFIQHFSRTVADTSALDRKLVDEWLYEEMEQEARSSFAVRQSGSLDKVNRQVKTILGSLPVNAFVPEVTQPYEEIVVAPAPECRPEVTFFEDAEKKDDTSAPGNGPAEQSVVSDEGEPEVQKVIVIPPGYITVAGMAKKRGCTKAAVLGWIKKGKIAFVEIGNKKYVDSNAVITDGRAGRTIPIKDGTGRKQRRIQDNSYEGVQLYIKERDLFVPEIAPFIKTQEEALYYANHFYHEIIRTDRLALIIDVKPDYYSEATGKTNRERILNGESPVVKGSEEYDANTETWKFDTYHLHHVGQSKDSPLAIIPGSEHNSGEWSSVFHLDLNAKENLHGQEFNQIRKEFWLWYLEEYNQGKDFNSIEYTSWKRREKEKGQNK